MIENTKKVFLFMLKKKEPNINANKIRRYNNKKPIKHID